jgi:outer membrane protein OmpA-like peptidoglycan-associated protein
MRATTRKRKIMKTMLKATVLASAILLGACASSPTTTSMLDQARGDFISANNNPQISSYAPLEFKQASDALDQANAAAAKRDSLEQIDKLAYIAKQKIATAREVAKTKGAEADMANAGKVRDQVRLDARTAEADRAKAEAEAAKLAASQAQGQALDADARTREAQARAAQLEAMMADLQAKKTERGMIITIGDVLFATGQATLTQAGMANLRKLADVMAQNPERTVLVEGFTDSVGADAYNLALSERRASAVRAALLSMGVAQQRMAMKGYGEAFPVAANDNAGNRQLNRRVEIVLSNAGAPITPRQ